VSLATDALIRKATTTTTNLSALIPQIWASLMELNLRRRAVLEQSLLVNTDLTVPGAGDRVFIPALPDITMAGALTEGTDINSGTPLSISNAASITLTPAEYGQMVEVTRKALDRIKYDGMTAIIDRLAYSMSMRLETNIAALYNATAGAGLPNSQVPFAGSTITTIPGLYPNGHTSANVVSTDVMSADVLSRAVAKLQQYDNVPFPDGNYWLFLTPDAYQSLIMDANIRQDLRYAAPDRLLNGDQGVVYGVRLILSNYLPGAQGNTAITENSNSVVKNLLVAPRWAAIAYKRRPEVIVDPTLYDLGRRRRFGVLADFDIQLVHAERAVVITTAKQF
jgi:N4-gp56 family major capsid protein